MTRKPLVYTVLALVLIVWVGWMFSTTAQSPRGLAATWVGKVTGSNALIGFASNGSELLAYICDGESISQWFYGKAGVDNLDLVAGTLELNANGNSLQANLSRTLVTGSVKIGARALRFQAMRATGDAGLYRAEETINNETLISGWVVLRSGELRGAQLNQSTGALQGLLTLSPAARIISPVISQY